jgi:membrane-bound lytic murein transglycosylase A
MFSFFKSKRFFLIVLLSCALLVEFTILYYFLILVPKKPPIKPPQKYLIEVQKDKIPQFIYSDKDFEELEKTFHREGEFLSQKILYKRKLAFGEKKLPASLIKESAQLLLETFQEAKIEEELNRLIRKRFTIHQAAGVEGEGEVLFTGYYSPVYEGSLKKQGPFRYPLYSKPKDLKAANLGEFNPALEGEKIVYRIDSSSGEIVPYWTRENIIKGKVLEGQNLEFVYLKDRIDRFYLMIQGSGKIVLEDGKSFWVRYSATNGRPYTSLGRLLAKEGEIPKDRLSMRSIRQYFQRHSQKMDKYLNQNERFIFLTKDEKKKGAIGAAGAELTPQRSIAIDKTVFPLGALAYIEYPEPEINREGEVVGIERTARFVFCQDTGGVIKGPGRVDIYFGEGKGALAKAGHLKGKGKLYFLIKKGS